MMKKAFKDVLNFHRKHDCYIGCTPSIPTIGTVELRKKLLDEEIKELKDAIDNNNIVEIADGVADACYVLIGLAISYGIYLPDIWQAVHQANMNKTGGKRVDGKVLKREIDKHADVRAIITRQSRTCSVK